MTAESSCRFGVSVIEWKDNLQILYANIEKYIATRDKKNIRCYVNRGFCFGTDCAGTGRRSGLILYAWL